MFVDYCHREGVSEKYPLAQEVNQSSLGTMLRATGQGDSVRSLQEPPFVLVAMVMVTLATAIVTAKSRGQRDPYSLAATLAMMLMIYAAALTHYGVQRLPGLLFLYSVGRQSSDRRNWVLSLIVVLSLLCAFKETCSAFLLMWFAMSLEGLRFGRSPHEKAATARTASPDLANS